MTDRREENNSVRWQWRGAIPVAAVTAVLQCFGGLFSAYQSNKAGAEVVKRIDELSHRLEIVAVKQDFSEPRFQALEADIRRLNEKITGLSAINSK